MGERNLFKKLFVVLILCVGYVDALWAYFTAGCTFRTNPITCNSVAGCWSTGVSTGAVTYHCEKCPAGTYKESYYQDSMDGCFYCTAPKFSGAFSQYQTASSVKENTWAYYMDGGESSDDCQWVAECSAGYYLQNGASGLSCVACANTNHSTAENNRFIGLGEMVQYFTKSGQNYEDYIKYACAPECPEHTVVSADGNGCECDVDSGYVSSGAVDANGFPVCVDGPATIEMYAYVFKNPKGDTSEDHTEVSCSTTLKSGTYTTWDSFISAISNDDTDACMPKMGYNLDSITVRITADGYVNHISVSKDYFIPLNISAGAKIVAGINIYPVEYTVTYAVKCPETDRYSDVYVQNCVYGQQCLAYTFDELTNKTKGQTFGDCLAFDTAGGIYVESGSYFQNNSYYVVSSELEDESVDFGEDITQWYTGENLELRFSPAVCPDGFYCKDGFKYLCPVGYYCSEGVSEPSECPVGYYCPKVASEPSECPAGTTTSEARAGSITDCYLGGDSKICDNNKKCFTGLPTGDGKQLHVIDSSAN